MIWIVLQIRSSRGSGSRRSKDQSQETMGCYHESPPHKRHERRNAALDVMIRTLRRVARSPFTDKIECTKMPRRFT